MERVEARGRMLGARAAEAARGRLAGRAGDALPDAAVGIDGDSVVLSGRDLRARMLREPVLRWIGSVMR